MPQNKHCKNTKNVAEALLLLLHRGP